MGSVLARNITEEVVNQAISSINTTVTNCSSSYDISSNFTISAVNGGQIDLTGVVCDFTNVYSVNTNCIGTSSISSSISSNVSQQAALTASAVSQNLNLDPGSTTAENIAQAVSDLSFNIQNNIYNTCMSTSLAEQGFNITANGPSSEVNVNNLVCNFSDTITSTQKCAFQSAITSQLTTNVEQAITEAASATMENALGWILMAVAVIFLVFFMFTLEASTWIFIILIIFLIIIIVYMVIAMIKNWWPFSRTTPLGSNNGVVASNVTLSPTTQSYTSPAFVPNVGTYQFVMKFLPLTPPPNTPSPTLDLTLNVNSANSSNAPQVFTLTPDITEVVSSPISLNGDIYTLKLSIPSSSPYSVTLSSITSRINPVPILAANNTIITNSTTYITPLTPFEFQVSQASSSAVTYNFTVTNAATVPPNLPTPPNLSIMLDPGIATANNVATISFVIPSGTTKSGNYSYNPNAGATRLTSTGTFTLPDNKQHTIVCFVDANQVEFASMTMAPATSPSYLMRRR